MSKDSGVLFLHKHINISLFAIEFKRYNVIEFAMKMKTVRVFGNSIFLFYSEFHQSFFFFQKLFYGTRRGSNFPSSRNHSNDGQFSSCHKKFGRKQKRRTGQNISAKISSFKNIFSKKKIFPREKKSYPY